MGRKIGYRQTKETTEAKYPIALKYLRKGFKLTEVLAICCSKNEKVSMRTLMRLKKEIA